MQLISTWGLRDAVHIDGDTSITGYVTAILFRVNDPPTYEVQWMHNGDNKIGWFTDWRLSRSPGVAGR
jgi:hypothetical protein